MSTAVATSPPATRRPGTARRSGESLKQSPCCSNTSLPCHHHRDLAHPQAWSHRHYIPARPTANKLLSQRWDSHARELHLRKLREARPTVDDGAPKVYRHLEMRLKALVEEQARLNCIENSNKILLDRIAHHTVRPSNVSDLEQARINTYIERKEQRKLTPSLNGTQRKKTSEKIQWENRVHLRRLEQKQPCYKRTDWLKDRCRNLEYIRNIAQYPQSYHRLLEGHEEEVVKSGLPGPKIGEHRLRAAVHAYMDDGKRKERCLSAPQRRERAQSAAALGKPEEKQLPPPGADLPIGRPPTRPNRMTGTLSDWESEDESLKAAGLDTSRLAPRLDEEADGSNASTPVVRFADASSTQESSQMSPPPTSRASSARGAGGSTHSLPPI
ncbi:hypothetical protein HDU85_004877 [Gaertneriomyces sp. JEL0708]|nr:hypothetical protein HDU85_004877 [Gaertneriomyces sp. JEL0708]